MAWRPAFYLSEGELDNTVRGKVSGWMEFLCLESRVTFDLDGEFHRDIRGAKIELCGLVRVCTDAPLDARCFDGFATHQTGKVGDITAGLPPRDYGASPYIEWYSDQNGRVVLELRSVQVEVIGTPIPACESDPVSREQQAWNMERFLRGVGRSVSPPPEENDRSRKDPNDAGEDLTT